MALRTLSPKNAAALDKELMSTGAFSIDQLMELAGLSVSQAVYKVHPPSKGKSILIACGPGNNGGDGLVAARHLHHFGYHPHVYYPKQPKNNDLYARLRTQLENLDVPILTDGLDDDDDDDKGSRPGVGARLIESTSASLIVDAVFGFSFSGPLRDPFPRVVKFLAESPVPVLAVDAPSSWDVEAGPPTEGPGRDFMPQTLVSLTAPKPCVRFFRGGDGIRRRHFLGGRFLSEKLARKYEIDVPPYEGSDQIVEVPVVGVEEEEEEASVGKL